MASVLAKRISCVLPDVVSAAQTGSIPGRTVFASLSLTRDLFTFATRCGIAGCFVSVDQAKAFDRVEHRYLLGVLRGFGFPSEIVNLIGALYTDLTARLLVNGQLSPRLNVTRGIRQGCPLSPLLFALCLDPLLRRWKRALAFAASPYRVRARSRRRRTRTMCPCSYGTKTATQRFCGFFPSTPSCRVPH